MKEILTDKMLHEIFTALEKGEAFEYSDDNTQITINPNGISIQYQSSSSEREVEDFLNYCDNLDDELFIEVCESFEEAELNELQHQLDTENYKNTIEVFTGRVQEIANNHLTEITNAANAELQRLEQVIADARNSIHEIYKEIAEANAKYSV